MLVAIAHTLRPGGMVSIQLPFFPDRTASTVPGANVPWSWDELDIRPGPRPGEVWLTPDQLPLVLEDFSTAFADLRLQFVDFPPATVRFGTSPAARLAHVVISGTTAQGLAARMYAPITK